MAQILVIDDELIMCELLGDLLKDRGYEVNYTLSGKEGINIAAQGGNDVIMLDLKMPEISGIQVLKEIRKTNPEAVVIVLTGYPSFESVQSALRLGAYDYVTKPFNIDDISFVIQKAIAFHDLTLTNKRLVKELEEYNKILMEKVEERTQELVLIYKIAQEISGHLNLKDVLGTIVNKVTTVLDAEICSILLLDKKSGELTIGAACGLSDEWIQKTRLSSGERISGWVLQHKEAVLIEDIEEDSRFARRNKEKYYTHSFISVPLLVNDEAIGVININNKRSREVFTTEDLRFIKGLSLAAAIAIENANLYASLEGTYLHTVKALTSAIDAKDHYTKNHSEHVTEYGIAISKEMGFSEEQVSQIRQACQLHDIGKIGVHDYILTKQGKLTSDEWIEMRLHSLKGAKILKPLSFLGEVVKLVEQHHERYDGKGYPFGLKGENILLGARIMAVADSYDAMITDRPYRKALTKEEAIEELIKNKETQFDPHVVNAFLRILKRDAK